jgi:acetyl-CoA carboxylase biotin carboxyl carrier protein
MSKNILGIFDGSDIEGITALIDSLEKSSFDYLKLEGGGVKIVIGKNGAGEATETAAIRAEAPAKAALAPAPEAMEAAAAPPVQTAAPKAAVSEEDGLFVVKSPSYGIFYAQAEPGAPTYVKLGDAVKTGDTLGLLEIMKTFNAISSDVDGELVKILIQNQEVLEPGQPLFEIRVK